MSPPRPLRVAIVGAGPAGFYTAAALLKHPDRAVHVDLFDRLPAPYGLVRSGVAPDHQNIKAVVRAYQKTAGHEAFRYFGNVALGRELGVEDLDRHYDQWVLCVGSGDDRRMGIPGEELPGVHPARSFVAWYNGHPDYVDETFNLAGPVAVVIGVGNVAVDVARVLTRDPDALHATDIATYAVDALRCSGVREVWMVGRRGPAQAAFTTQELKELAALPGVDVIVDPADLELDPLTRAALEAAPDPSVTRNLELLAGLAARGATGAPRRVRLAFFASPVEIVGAERVSTMRLARMRLEGTPDRPRAVQTGETFDVPTGLVLRSIGYRGVPLPGVAFDERLGLFPNEEGRLLDAVGGAPVGRGYCAGWCKRGPSGVIGTNRADAQATVAAMIADGAGRFLEDDPARRPEAVDALLAARGAEVLTWDDWERVEKLEHDRGAALGKVRDKLVRVSDFLAARDAHVPPGELPPGRPIIGR